MVTVKKKSAAAIAGFVLFLQGPMPAWAQEAAEVVQNTQVQTEATVKASTEEAIEKAEEQVHQLEAQIEEYKKKVTEFDDLLNKISETEKIAENVAKIRERELLEAENASKMSVETAKAKAAEFEKSKKEKEIELSGLKEAYKAAKEQYDNAKIYLNGLQSNEQEKSQIKERAAANVNKYESQISNLHKEVDSLNESIASDSAKIREYDTKIGELESALGKADQNNGGNIYSIAEQFKNISNDQVSLSRKVEENKKLVADKQRTLNELDANFKTEKQEFEQASTELQKIKDQIEESKKDVAKKLEAFNSKDSEVKQVESDVNLLGNIIENYKLVGKENTLAEKIASLRNGVEGAKAFKKNQPDARAKNNELKKQAENSLSNAEKDL
ncbi:chromosome partitioning protein ParA, partial [Bifidobacteriaceae bacterium NR015]